jgi:hypothetical protein
MEIMGAGTNGVLKFAGWGGLGILHMQVGCGWEWVITQRGSLRRLLASLHPPMTCFP